MGNKVPDVRTDADYHHVQKVWGSETWIVNNEKYCGKMLMVLTGRHTSMHFHSLKHETMFCCEGAFDIWFVDENGDRVLRRLEKGQSIVIEPNTPHEIWGASDAGVNIMFEFSTQHFDSDSYRVSKSG